MPDPVSSHSANNDPSIIQCDDNVGREPDAPPANASRNVEPGVRALVGPHAPPLVVRREETIRVPTQINVGEIALECAGKAVGAVLGAIGATRLPPWLGIPTALKAGSDLGQCIGNSVHDATARAAAERAEERCTEEGGSSVGIVNGALICEVPRAEEE